MSLDELYKSIQTREDFVLFVEGLRKDLRDDPESWENPDLERFLEALGRWVHVAAAEQPDWKLVGAMLMAARSYE